MSENKFNWIGLVYTLCTCLIYFALFFSCIKLVYQLNEVTGSTNTVSMSCSSGYDSCNCYANPKEPMAVRVCNDFMDKKLWLNQTK